MTSKQRAYLKGLAMNLDPVMNVGKESLTPGITEAVREVLEAHLFGCNEDLYGHVLETAFCRFLRNERRFSSLEELKAQLEKDKADALAWFAAQNHEQ